MLPTAAEWTEKKPRQTPHNPKHTAARSGMWVTPSEPAKTTAPVARVTPFPNRLLIRPERGAMKTPIK